MIHAARLGVSPPLSPELDFSPSSRRAAIQKTENQKMSNIYKVEFRTIVAVLAENENEAIRDACIIADCDAAYNITMDDHWHDKTGSVYKTETISCILIRILSEEEEKNFYDLHFEELINAPQERGNDENRG